MSSINVEIGNGELSNVTLGYIQSVFIDDNSSLNNGTLPEIVAAPLPLWQLIVLGILAAAVVVVTVVGNVIVVLSFVIEGSIREPGNFFIASLAVSDLLIGHVSMPFYTIYILAGHYWPLGENLCDLWLSLDYTACLTSIYTVLCITIDRFCSVIIPAKYRNWRSPKKVNIIISLTWIVPICVFFPSIFGYQYFVGKRTVPKGKCYIQYMDDPIFNLILQVGYFWITMVIMIILYSGIYRVALKLQRKSDKKQKKMSTLVSMAGQTITKIGIGMSNSRPETTLAEPTNRPGSSSGHKRIKRERSISSTSDSHSDDSSFERSAVPKNMGNVNNGRDSNAICMRIVQIDRQQQQAHDFNPEDSRAKTEKPTATESGGTERAPQSPVWKMRESVIDRSRRSLEISEDPDEECLPLNSSPEICTEQGPCRKKARVLPLRMLLNRNSGRDKSEPPKPKSRSENRASKALRTITIILGAFVLCWTPWHILSLVLGSCGENCHTAIVQLYDISYWLCYLNSPINPFCYAMANQRFKKTFLRIIRLDWHRT